jgi:hypothetical protein
MRPSRIGRRAAGRETAGEREGRRASQAGSAFSEGETRQLAAEPDGARQLPSRTAGRRRYGSVRVEFVLQFPMSEVPDLAARYAYEDDEAVIAMGEAACVRGYYSRDEFVAVCRWKTPRSASRVALNSVESIERATGAALAESSSERARIEALRSLHGVEWPTASVLLHLSYPERYPILDKRALHALGVRAPSAYSFRFWWAYVTACRQLAEQAGVDGRTLDQALWQWSKEQPDRLY